MRKVVFHDLLASVVVFLVALPLCLGIAIASGAPPAAGLISGIVGGLLVGAIGGAPLQVSGPAAGLAVIVWDLVQQHGMARVGVIVLLAGAFQMVAGARRLGRWFQAVPPAVIYGMLAGIGVLIFASQFHVMLDDKPRGSGVANLITIPAALYKVFTPTVTPHESAAAMGVLTIVTIILWNGPVARRWPRIGVIPGALIAVVVATTTAYVLKLPIARVTLPDNFVASLGVPDGSAFRILLQPSTIAAAAALAAVASAETLLCASAVDRMHDGPRTNYDRELFAQGLGNAVCGLLGGLPITGVIVRSSANVEAGARTRWSAVMHGLWLLGFVAVAPFLLRNIPISSLAGLLVFTGYKLMRQDVAELRRAGVAEVAIFFATVTGIVMLDLLKGVAIGLALSAGRLIWLFSRLRVDVRERADGSLIVRLRGVASFLGLPELNGGLAKVPEGRSVHIDLSDLDHADHACEQGITAWKKLYEGRGGVVDVDLAALAAKSGPWTLRPSRPSRASGPPAAV